MRSQPHGGGGVVLCRRYYGVLVKLGKWGLDLQSRLAR